MMAIGFSFILDSNNKEDVDDIKLSLKRIEESLKQNVSAKKLNRQSYCVNN